MSSAREDVHRVVAEHLREIILNREKYLTAWVAETGLHPCESELVEDRSDPRRTVFTVRKRSGAIPSTEKMKARAIAGNLLGFVSELDCRLEHGANEEALRTALKEVRRLAHDAAEVLNPAPYGSVVPRPVLAWSKEQPLRASANDYEIEQRFFYVYDADPYDETVPRGDRRSVAVRVIREYAEACMNAWFEELYELRLRKVRDAVADNDVEQLAVCRKALQAIGEAMGHSVLTLTVLAVDGENYADTLVRLAKVEIEKAATK